MIAITIGETNYSTGTFKLVIANPGERGKRIVLWFGTCGTTRILCYADHLEDAFDIATDWIAENAPGLLCNDEVQEEYDRQIQEAIERGEDPQDDDVQEHAWEIATQDTTTVGNNCHRIQSWECGLIYKNASRADILALINDPRSPALGRCERMPKDPLR